MNSYKLFLKVVILSFFVLTCKKQETTPYESQTPQSPISMIANQEIKDKKFIKKVNIKLETENAYHTSIAIEKKVKEWGGFITLSDFNNNFISEDRYLLSDQKEILIRKYEATNKSQIKIPTIHLEKFLDYLNEQEIFLHYRNITAEDITANIKLAEIEQKRLNKTQKKLEHLKPTAENIKDTDTTMLNKNLQEISSANLSDHIKYSTINIDIQEIQPRITKIEMENRRQNYFKYQIKDALISGIDLFQKILIGIVNLWVLILMGGIIYYLWRNKKHILSKVKRKKM